MALDMTATNLSGVISKNIPRIKKGSESEYVPSFSNYIVWVRPTCLYILKLNNKSQQIECISWYENLRVVYYKVCPPKSKNNHSSHYVLVWNF